MADLIDRDELRKDFCNMCEAMQPEMIDCEKKGCMSMQIIDEQPAVNRWIPVEDALPEYDTMVIVCYYGSDCIFPMQGETVTEAIARQNKVPTVTIGFLDEEGWNGADMFPMMIQPTFWMPLPEPPESEVQND